MSEWNGKHLPSIEANMRTYLVPKGSTLKVVMVSRFGDCGLTDDLETDYGYGLRLDWEDAAMTDIRETKEPSKLDLGSDAVGAPADGMG